MKKGSVAAAMILGLIILVGGILVVRNYSGQTSIFIDETDLLPDDSFVPKPIELNPNERTVVNSINALTTSFNTLATYNYQSSTDTVDPADFEGKLDSFRLTYSAEIELQCPYGLDRLWTFSQDYDLEGDSLLSSDEKWIKIDYEYGSCLFDSQGKGKKCDEHPDIVKVSEEFLCSSAGGLGKLDPPECATSLEGSLNGPLFYCANSCLESGWWFWYRNRWNELGYASYEQCYDKCISDSTRSSNNIRNTLGVCMDNSNEHLIVKNANDGSGSDVAAIRQIKSLRNIMLETYEGENLKCRTSTMEENSFNLKKNNREPTNIRDSTDRFHGTFLDSFIQSDIDFNYYSDHMYFWGNNELFTHNRNRHLDYDLDGVWGRYPLEVEEFSDLEGKLWDDTDVTNHLGQDRDNILKQTREHHKYINTIFPDGAIQSDGGGEGCADSATFLECDGLRVYVCGYTGLQSDSDLRYYDVVSAKTEEITSSIGVRFMYHLDDKFTGDSTTTSNVPSYDNTHNTLITKNQFHGFSHILRDSNVDASIPIDDTSTNNLKEIETQNVCGEGRSDQEFGETYLYCNKEQQHCDVCNFNLPQNIPEDRHAYLQSYGDPEWLFYYEAFPVGEDSYWILEKDEFDLGATLAFNAAGTFASSLGKFNQLINKVPLFSRGLFKLKKAFGVVGSVASKVPRLLSVLNVPKKLARGTANVVWDLGESISSTTTKRDFWEHFIKKGQSLHEIKDGTKLSRLSLRARDATNELYEIKNSNLYKRLAEERKFEEIDRVLKENKGIIPDGKRQDILKKIKEIDDSATLDTLEDISAVRKIELQEAYEIPIERELPKEFFGSGVEEIGGRSALYYLVYSLISYESANEKYVPIGVNSIGYRNPYETTVTTNSNSLLPLDESAINYILMLTRDVFVSHEIENAEASQSKTRLYFASPCKANIRVKKDVCQCKNISSSNPIQVDSTQYSLDPNAYGSSNSLLLANFASEGEYPNPIYVWNDSLYFGDNVDINSKIEECTENDMLTFKEGCKDIFNYAVKECDGKIDAFDEVFETQCLSVDPDIVEDTFCYGGTQYFVEIAQRNVLLFSIVAGIAVDVATGALATTGVGVAPALVIDFVANTAIAGATYQASVQITEESKWPNQRYGG